MDVKVLKITGVKFYSLLNSEMDYGFTDNIDPANGQQQQQHPCHAIHKFYSSGCFYFSREKDLTLNSQKRSGVTYDETAINFWKNIDERFFWNNYLLKDLIHVQSLNPSYIDLNRLLVPILQGFFEIQEVNLFGKLVKTALISRVSRERTGTRFNTRGIDDNGSVANFVETEQIIYVDEICASYVQIRGSVPVFWEQKGLQVGGHSFELSRGTTATAPAFARHFEQQFSHYGNIAIVNLLSPKSESSLLNAYVHQIDKFKNPKVSYTAFDFNSQIKNHNYDNLSLLLRGIHENISKFQFFLANMTTGEVFMKQTGVFRVNCVDCLDRFDNFNFQF